MADKSDKKLEHIEHLENTEEKPMIIAGIAASQAIDSSAEVLDVEGCDITSLKEGKGYLNWEHLQKDNDKSVPGSEIVGKIIFAKKIFSEKDCEDALQEHFWEQAKTPFVYIVGRLFNAQPGHASSKHIAGIIRDAIQHKEDLVIGFSIEGSTLKRSGNKLTHCVAKNCAVTLQPCNKTAKFVVVSDPYLNIDGDVQIKKTELTPVFAKIGHHSMVYDQNLLKTLAAGSTDVAPSSSIQGSALQVEGLARKETKKKIRHKLLSALYKWDGSKSIRDLIRAEMPEVSDDFLDHFDKVVEQKQVKLKKAQSLSLDKTEDVDTSFEFGANVAHETDPHAQGKEVIARMRSPKKEMAEQFLHYVRGHTQVRPTITPDLERHLARFGIVDPKGYSYDANGRDLAVTRFKSTAGEKEPEGLRNARLTNSVMLGPKAIPNMKRIRKSEGPPTVRIPLSNVFLLNRWGHPITPERVDYHLQPDANTPPIKVELRAGDTGEYVHSADPQAEEGGEYVPFEHSKRLDPTHPKYFVSDGHHRVRAAQERGDTHIDAEVNIPEAPHYLKGDKKEKYIKDLTNEVSKFRDIVKNLNKKEQNSHDTQGLDLLETKSRLTELSLDLQKALSSPLDIKTVSSKLKYAIQMENEPKVVDQLFEHNGVHHQLNKTEELDWENLLLVSEQEILTKSSDQNMQKIQQLLHEIANPHLPTVKYAEQYVLHMNGEESNLTVSPKAVYMNGHILDHDEIERIKQAIRNKQAKLTSVLNEEKIAKIKQAIS